jgi:hypothetical protein
VGENERLLASLLLSPRFIIHLLYIIIEEPPKSFASDNKHRDPGAENIGTSRTQFLFFFVTIWCGFFFWLAFWMQGNKRPLRGVSNTRRIFLGAVNYCFRKQICSVVYKLGMETGVFKISVVFLSVRFVENSTVESYMYDLSCAQHCLQLAGCSNFLRFT